MLQPVAAERKYDWGAGARGCEAADYPHEASLCEGQEFGGTKGAFDLQTETLCADN